MTKFQFLKMKLFIKRLHLVWFYVEIPILVLLLVGLFFTLVKKISG